MDLNSECTKWTMLNQSFKTNGMIKGGSVYDELIGQFPRDTYIITHYVTTTSLYSFSP